MKRFEKIFLIIALLTLGGCAVGPNYHTPSAEMPKRFYSPENGDPKNSPASADIVHWWHGFKDPQLDKLIDQAVQSNLDLKIALARLQESREMEASVAGNALPSMDASAGAGRGSGTNSTKGRVAGPLNSGTNTTGLKQITEAGGVDAEWEIDLFGKYRREVEAARAQAQVSVEVRNGVLIAVVSDVARAYMDAVTAQNRINIANENIKAEEQTVDMAQQRYQRGLTNGLDVELARRQLATVKSTLEPLKTNLRISLRQLAILFGRYPEDIKLSKLPDSLPDLPASVDPGIPVDLLRRRPDIRQAERELAMQTALIGVHTADLFPQLSLTAGAGMQGQGLGISPGSNSFIWSVGPSAYWPILDFGRLDAILQAQKFSTQASLIAYKQTIIKSVQEVNNAIDSYASQQHRLQDLADALAASKKAVELATGRYQQGLTDFLNVTDAERQMYEIEDQYLAADENAVLEYIAVYKSLGGGWEDYQSIPTVPQPRPAIMAALSPNN